MTYLPGSEKLAGYLILSWDGITMITSCLTGPTVSLNKAKNAGITTPSVRLVEALQCSTSVPEQRTERARVPSPQWLEPQCGVIEVVRVG
jgi:hypothetical protein